MRTPRFYDFTLNNPSGFEPKFEEKVHVWLKYQTETAPTTGTQHLQGVIAYINPTTLKDAQKDFDGRASLRPVRNLKALSRYVHKEGGSNPKEYGQEPQSMQGSRNDLKGFREAVAAGAKRKFLFETHTGPMLRFFSAQEKMRQYLDPRRIRFRQVIELREDDITQDTKDHAFWIDGSQDRIWWDGYDDQETIIVEHGKIEDWLKYERHQSPLAMKNSMFYLQATRIIVLRQ